MNWEHENECRKNWEEIHNAMKELNQLTNRPLQWEDIEEHWVNKIILIKKQVEILEKQIL